MKILHIGQVIGVLDIYIRNSILYAEGDYEYSEENFDLNSVDWVKEAIEQKMGVDIGLY